MPRQIIVGDVHGCSTELEALLTSVALRPADRLVFLGDLVDRGPDSLGVIHRVASLLAEHPGSLSLAGNHEELALRRRDRGELRSPWCAEATEADWQFLESLPLLVRLPEAGMVAVHGGLYPRLFEHYGTQVEPSDDWRKAKGKKADRLRRLLRIRCIGDTGDMVSLDASAGQTHWVDRYQGELGFCFYGHDPQLEPPVPRRAPHAMGLDTGCCFGGRLTAAVLDEGTAPARATIVSVPARAAYAEPRFRLEE